MDKVVKFLFEWDADSNALIATQINRDGYNPSMVIASDVHPQYGPLITSMLNDLYDRTVVSHVLGPQLRRVLNPDG